MKLIVAVLYVSRTMGLTRCYKTERFFTFIYAVFLQNFMLFLYSDSHLRKRKSICRPNFDEISQSTAEFKLLPVSENGRTPYWNTTSGFDFGLIFVIG